MNNWSDLETNKLNKIGTKNLKLRTDKNYKRRIKNDLPTTFKKHS